MAGQYRCNTTPESSGTPLVTAYACYAIAGSHASTGWNYQPSPGWYIEFLTMLEDIEKLPDDWDGSGALRPPKSAIASAKMAMEIISDIEIRPRSVQATPDGGVAITFIDGQKYADLEFFDKEPAVALLEDLRDRNERIFEVMPYGNEIRDVLTQICEHLASA